MTDRELLTLAAKAAGMEGMRYASPYRGMEKMLDPTRPETTGSIGPDWNPLVDDGDALRLAVRLHIGIKSNGPDHWQEPNTSVAIYEIGDFGGRVMVRHGDGPPQKATRRAIVRAAAEIGRNMK